MMSLSVLHAGDGYAYLLRSVATGDRSPGRKSLTDYYAASGTPPGRWFGRGLDSLAVPQLESVRPYAERLVVAGEVTETQMQHLFGVGLHPNYEDVYLSAIQATALDGLGTRARNKVLDDVQAAGKLGSKYATFTNHFPVLEAIDAVVDQRAGTGEKIDAAVRRQITLEVAPDFFTKAKGRAPGSEREVLSWVAATRRQVRRPVAGFDLTFTPAKSISVLWALADKPVAQKIEAAHRQAVNETLTWIEDHAAFSRAGAGSKAQVDVEGLVVAQFDHWDTRSGDPNLHTHCAVANKVRGADGKWRSLDSKALHRHAVAASERYNARVAELIEQTIGVTFTAREQVAGRQPVREIAGIPDALIAAFSSRRSAITPRRDELVAAYRAKHGYSPSKQTEYQLLQQATLDTRQGKQSPRSLDQIRAESRRRADTVLGPGGVDALLQAVTGPDRQPVPKNAAMQVPEWVSRHLPEDLPLTPGPDGQRPAWIGTAVAAQVAVAMVSERRADWTENHLRSRIEAMSMLFSFPTPAGRRTAVEDTITAALEVSVPIGAATTDPDLPAALRRRSGASVFTRSGEAKYTSHQILAAEHALVRAAESITIYSALNQNLDAVLGQMQAETGRELNPGQEALVRHFCQSGRALAVGTGPAGAGKTTAMTAVVRTWKKEGHDVIALAPSAAAAAVLGDEVAADGRTIASLTYRWRGLHTRTGQPAKTLPEDVTITRGTMLLVDEAAMASTQDLAALYDIAHTHGAIVRLLGDPAQLDAVETGGALRMLADRTNAPELDTVVRFGTDTEQAENSLRIRAGDPDGLAMFARRGWITTGTTTELLDAVFDGFIADTAAGKQSLMLASTNDEIFGLNTRAQTWRTTTGAVRTDHGAADLADGQAGYVGDRIVTRRNDRRLRTRGGTRPGTAVLNGDLWTIQQIHGDGSVTVRHDDHHGSVHLPADYVRTSAQLGYASTIHRAQGMTVDHCRAVIGTHTDRAGAYVAMTRGRAENRVYVSDSIDLDTDIEAHQLAGQPETITGLDRLRTVLNRDEHVTAATDQIQAALTEAADPNVKREAWLYAHGLLRDQWITGLIDDIVTGHAGTTIADRLAEHPDSHQRLVTALGRVFDSGHHPHIVLGKAITAGPLDTADDVAAVLGHRIGDASRREPRRYPAPVPAHPGRDDELADWANRARREAIAAERRAQTDPLDKAREQLKTNPLAHISDRALKHELTDPAMVRHMPKMTLHGAQENRQRSIDALARLDQAEHAQQLATRIAPAQQLEQHAQQLRARLTDLQHRHDQARMWQRRALRTELAALEHDLAQVTDQYQQACTGLPDRDQWNVIAHQAQTAPRDIDQARQRLRDTIADYDAQIADSERSLARHDARAQAITDELARRDTLTPAERRAEQHLRTQRAKTQQRAVRSDWEPARLPPTTDKAPDTGYGL